MGVDGLNFAQLHIALFPGEDSLPLFESGKPIESLFEKPSNFP